MDWLWPLFAEHVTRQVLGGRPVDDRTLQETFLQVLARSRATLYGMQPVGEGIRFKALGQWPVPAAPELLADPNGFIADRFGGGKFKLNLHHGATFVCTHNFRTWGDPRWEAMDEAAVED